MGEQNRSSVALIEDDLEMSSMLRDYLEFKGFSVHSFQDPAVFLKHFQEGFGHRLGALVSDIHLPSMSGVSLLKKVRETSPHLPVLLISAQANQAHQSESHALGAKLLHKPFGLEPFYNTLVGLLCAASASSAISDD